MSSQIIATSRSATGIPTGRLAVWWVIASEIVIFGGLLGCYLIFRFRHYDNWSYYASFTSTAAGTINTFVLLTSSLFIVLAHAAAERKDTAKSFLYIWLTILGGGIFMCVKAVEYSSKFSHDFFITTNNFFGFYYVATGLHGFHVLVGMLIMAIISFDVKKGKHLGRVENIGIYWHFVDVVWIFLFPLLYIAK